MTAEKESDEMVVTPWEVSGVVDYNRLVEQFGTKPMTRELLDRLERHAGQLHLQLRRGIFFSHRDLDWWIGMHEAGQPVGLYTGRGPSGPVHLGHLLPWFFTKYLQDAFGADLYFQMTDDEKFLIHPELSLDDTVGFAYDNALDLIACGLEPERTHIISDVNHIGHIYRLALRVAKHVTFSTIRAVFGLRDSDNIGIIWFPAIQATPCFIQSVREGRNVAVLIPAAIDQDPYWRMTRDIAERLGFYKPAQIHAKFLPGLGRGGKMSASMPETAIFTIDPPEEAAKKIMDAFTGGRPTAREQRELGGDPSICTIYAYHYYLFEEDDGRLAELERECRSGDIVCGDCKARLAEAVKRFLVDFQRKREKARDSLDQFLFK
ncbi:tryptophan--tRNA ligase [miscellaneous Crenarchaeota group-15 archaeon DG-45]|uniref:Tryptophan--tRNA ligase n=1 Tax=miscellaneous Crenarchaeota group-15 archaeon DG-45 TaxID=1685127 RepID=A0A0M0BT46_9ARCH|nr:MAG: tryptophan--tRNA ligase [miscellaneous Crenarchaeota group-15 archaeon DG-45]